MQVLFLFMQKIGEISLENTVTVKVDCQVNEDLIVKNFSIIIDCLKEMQAKQSQFDNKLNQHDNQLSSMHKQSESIKNAVSSSASNAVEKREGAQPQASHDYNSLKEMIKILETKTQKNQKNVMDNIKDINLLNKQVQSLKDEINSIKSGGINSESKMTSDKDSNNSSNGVNIDSINTLNKQMKQSMDDINKLKVGFQDLKKSVIGIDERVKQLENSDSSKFQLDSKDNQNEKNSNQNDEDGLSHRISDMRDKIGVLQKRVAVLQKQSLQNSENLKDLSESHNNLSNSHQSLKQQVQKLKRMLESIGNSNNGNSNNGNSSNDEQFRRLKKQIEQLRRQIQNLKKENFDSKTSLEEEGSKRFDRGSYTQTKFKNQDRDILARLEHLQKMLGSKRSIQDDSKSNQDKLPLIKRPQRKQRDISTHEKSSSKKDMADLKNQMQIWLNNYLQNNKTKDNLEDIQLKIQELRNQLSKKADQEGMRKGLTFLEGKINQIYLFLTQPDGEDAMIVRKGFNCLSCSKKVQKMRGKLGPQVNWNNMTSTNYSPPKVGYSRNMGHNSQDKDDDL